MTSEPQLSFPPFRLDLANEQLWPGAELLPVRPKAFRLLRYLAEHPQPLVTQEELLKAWQHSYLSDGLLRGYIRELRGLLGDDAKAPRFIEAESGRGYRFIASITPTPPVPSPIESSVPPTLHAGFVGRQEELAQLHRALERALLAEMRWSASKSCVGRAARVVDTRPKCGSFASGPACGPGNISQNSCEEFPGVMLRFRYDRHYIGKCSLCSVRPYGLTPLVPDPRCYRDVRPDRSTGLLSPASRRHAEHADHQRLQQPARRRAHNTANSRLASWS